MTTLFKTLDELISRTDKYDIHNITFYTITDDQDLLIPDTNLFRIYLEFIKTYIGTYKVTDKQREKYKYHPDMLSYDVYGTSELSWLILILNDRECASKFTLKSTIQLINPTDLSYVFDLICTQSSTRLKENWDKYLTMITT